jgi:SAM-dependent methyltransferase
MDEERLGADSGTSPMDYDAELRLLNEVFRRAYGIERHDHVLDIGCGAGQTTREAARLAAEGGALGVDLSAEAIARARDLAQAEGIRNVTFERADAQVHPFPWGRFDLAISRFGTMFFVDPVAAFANIGRALRPAGRLVMMVWQGHEQNEWSLAIEEALGGSSDAPASEASDPFSLADPTRVEGDPGCGGLHGRNLHRRPPTHPLRSGRRGRARVGPRLHVHEGGAFAFGQRIGGAGARAPPREARSER